MDEDKLQAVLMAYTWQGNKALRTTTRDVEKPGNGRDDESGMQCFNEKSQTDREERSILVER